MSSYVEGIYLHTSLNYNGVYLNVCLVDMMYISFVAAQVDGNWGPWSTFSACSKTCGEGSQSKFRLCNSPAPSNGGAGCSGDQVVVSTCNDQDCDDNDSYGAAYVNVSYCPL